MTQKEATIMTQKEATIMTQQEATIRVNISVLETLMKTYGTNRSLCNVADNERARLRFYEKQSEKHCDLPSYTTENKAENLQKPKC